MYETYAGLLAAGGYNMRMLRSKTLFGPYLDPYGNKASDNGVNTHRYGVKIIGNYQFKGQPG